MIIKQIKKKDITFINNENENNDFNFENKNNEDKYNINNSIKDKFKNEIMFKKDNEINKITNNNITNNISYTLAPLKPKSNYLSTFNTNSNDNININNIDNNKNNINNIITLKENTKIKNYKKEAEFNQILYKNIYHNYQKKITLKIIKQNKKIQIIKSSFYPKIILISKIFFLYQFINIFFSIKSRN